jgi:hypothetical protein
MNNEFYTIKDEEGILRPMAFLWKNDPNLKYHIPEIKKALKGSATLTKIIIKEIGDVNINSLD